MTMLFKNNTYSTIQPLLLNKRIYINYEEQLDTRL